MKGELLSSLARVRRETERLCEPLTVEDHVVQSMPDASPAKWHLAHTTWFFEAFVLPQAIPSYEPYRQGFSYLFNSYYEAVGPRHARDRRGVVVRPTLDEVRASTAERSTRGSPSCPRSRPRSGARRVWGCTTSSSIRSSS